MLILFTLFALFVLAHALSCDEKYQCISVTQNYNYVECINNTCVCLSNLGFSGSAKSTSKCDCIPPLSVYWKNSQPYCITYEDGVKYQLEKARDELLKSKVNELYNSILWPTAASLAGQIAAGTLMGGYFELFDYDVIGRIDPVGDISGFEGVAEYFVGSVWTGLARVESLFFDKLSVDGNDVYVNLDIHFGRYDNITSTVPLYRYNLTQTGTFTFNSNDKIKSINLIIRNLGLTIQSDQKSPETLQNICNVIMFVAHCNATYDPDGYYTNFTDCYNFMNNINYGTWDDARQNTVICRTYHSTLSLLRPQIHCPHVGKTGGGKCIPHTAEELYLQRF